MCLSVSWRYRARSHPGFSTYAVGLRLMLAPSSSPAATDSPPGCRLSCARWMLAQGWHGGGRGRREGQGKLGHVAGRVFR